MCIRLSSGLPAASYHHGRALGSRQQIPTASFVFPPAARPRPTSAKSLVGRRQRAKSCLLGFTWKLKWLVVKEHSSQSGCLSTWLMYTMTTTTTTTTATTATLSAAGWQTSVDLI